MSESYAGKINRKLLKKRRIINAAAGRVHSRRRDLSVLRSVGMTRGQELCMLVYEGVFSGVLAAAAAAWCARTISTARS